MSTARTRAISEPIKLQHVPFGPGVHKPNKERARLSDGGGRRLGGSTLRDVRSSTVHGTGYTHIAQLVKLPRVGLSEAPQNAQQGSKGAYARGGGRCDDQSAYLGWRRRRRRRERLQRGNGRRNGGLEAGTGRKRCKRESEIDTESTSIATLFVSTWSPTRRGPKSF